MRSTATAVAVFLLAVPCVSPARSRSPGSTPAADTALAGGPFDKLRFRSIGPATMSGRIDDFAVYERDPRVFYIGAATGGLWKTTNGGVTVTPVFDSAGVGSVGAVAISASDPNLVWVGTGEGNNRQSSSWGDGVYKSTDGGRRWAHSGLGRSRQIARIVVDPVDPEVVYVAALGDLWTAGGDRGIYKTTDGGLSWTRVLDGGPDAGGTELVMDPRNNKVLYAAIHQRRRSAWGMNGGGPASGIYKTADAGRTWTRLTRGIPAGDLGRIGLDVFRRNPNIVYARIEHEKEGGIYRSDDAGVSWRKMGSTNGRPMYFGIIRVDPEDDLRIYLPQTQLGISDDGGKTFRMDGAERIHVDHHALWINPNNPAHLLIGNDGGVGISYDRAATWMWLPHLPVGQFYHVGFDMQDPYHLCGGLQDNDTWCGPSQVRSTEGIANDEWHVVSGGDGFVGLIDPTNHRIVYAESQDGFISRVDRITNERQSIRPEAPEGQPPYRWNWDTPMMLSPHAPGTLYAGAQKLLKSVDRGMSWTEVSGDLTMGVDRDTLALMAIAGKDIKLAKNDGVSTYGTLFTIAESHRRAGLLYTGSDDGQLHASLDGGASWTNVSAKIPGVPRWAYVSKVEPSKFADGTVYATFDAHRTGDYGAYVYASDDFGASWRSLAATLPAGEVARSITEDVRNPEVLYLATETGIFVTTDRGRRWVRFKANLPAVPVYEITLHPRDNAMILATHGRALWVLDDLTPIQQYAAAQGSATAHLFEIPRAVYRPPAEDRNRFFEGNMQFLGQNPPVGATIAYHLPAKADSARVVIRDPAGAEVRVLKGSELKDQLGAGLNTVLWDLRSEPIQRADTSAGSPGGVFAFFGGSGSRGTPGPMVMPGVYGVTLVVNGVEAGARTVEVRGDPAVQITDSDRRNRQAVLEELQRIQASVTDASDAIRSADSRLQDVKKALADTTKVPGPMRAAVDSVTLALDTLKKVFGIRDPGAPFDFDFGELMKILPIKVAMLSGNIGGAMAPPTRTDLRRVGEVRRDAPVTIDRVNDLLERIRGMYRRLADAGLYPPVPASVRQP